MNLNEATPQILKLPLFQGFGVEIEYMIVDQENLNVLPITDKVFHTLAEGYPSEVERGALHWSNELALHVIELKTAGPIKTLAGIHHTFQDHVKEINSLLESFHACLMPTAMHPWMNPNKEMKLWPHEYNPIYEAYNRIFNCTGHGWANLQSVHLNLPFSNDEEFAKLHGAIRLILPILPALAASSPIIEKRLTNVLDTRLNVYRQNAAFIPSISGKIIPEVSLSREDYEKNILQKMYKDIAPQDPEKILQHEWLNSRGAIARFERYTIEIRLIDAQECPKADCAILQAVTETLKALVSERWASLEEINSCDINKLYQQLLACIKDGEQAIITDKNYLKCFGYANTKEATAGDLWEHLCKTLLNATNSDKETLQTLDTLLTQGPLARRIIRAWQKKPDEIHLHTIYKQLCLCLAQGQLFLG